MNITPKHITLRHAGMTDASMLLEWRNDPDTRKQSINQEAISYESHINWLRNTLEDADRHLYVAQMDKEPVGTVRADYMNGVYEISWTVAPAHRGKNIGAAMVERLVAILDGPVYARVRHDNTASQKIAQRAGLQFCWQDSDFIHFKSSREPDS